MSNPNPFYRFKQAWNAGFYPDNQIVSDLLNELSQDITTALPTLFTAGVTPLSQLVNEIKLMVEAFNAYPYYGNFSVSLDLVSAPPNYNFTIIIKDQDLFNIDNTQEFQITGVASNPAKIVSSATAGTFIPGAYIGSFDAPAIAEEDKVKEALYCVKLNGSAIFPITYRFDPLTNVATSGLARGKDWKLDDQVISRFPAPTLPLENQRTFELPQLNGDDTYIISIMERIIQASFVDSDYTNSIIATYDSFTLPNGWVGYINHPVFTTYERVQFDFVDATRRKLILVGRRVGGAWLWQRFVSDAYMSSSFDFLTTYSESTALPYEPNQAGRWLYNSDTYDLEFVEFTSGCYVSNEFYPMPAKPGDQFQFNIVDANLTGIEQANIGLFTESGSFIQKIGESNLITTDCIEPLYTPYQYTGEVTIPAVNGCYRMGLYNVITPEGPTTDCQITFTKLLTDFQGEDYTNFLIYIHTIAAGPNPYITFQLSGGNPYVHQVTETETIEEIVAWCNLNIPGMIASSASDSNMVLWKWTKTYPCSSEGYTMSCFNSDSAGGFLNGIWETPEYACSCEPKCTIWQTAYYDGQCGAWFESVSDNPTEYLGLFIIDPITLERTILHKIECSTILAPGQFYTWINSIPGMYFYQSPDIEGNCQVFASYEVEVPCGTEYYWDFGIFDIDDNYITSAIIGANPLDATSCECDSSCESTFVIELEGENAWGWLDNLITLQYPLYTLYITDGTTIFSAFTFQTPAYINPFIYDEVLLFFNSIPGMTAVYDSESTILSLTLTTTTPCGVNLNMILAGADYAFEGTLTTIETSTNASCDCPDPFVPTDIETALYSLSNIVNIDASDCFSTMLEFWAASDSVAQGFEYFNNWKQRIRIGLNGGGQKPIIEENLYRQSNGVHRRPQNKQDLSLDLHTDFFDLDTQLAMTDATRHSNLVWEGKSIFVKGDIEVATTQDYTTQSSFETLSQMKFQALIQGFQPRNSSCLTC
jgi:hypothetical protein